MLLGIELKDVNHKDIAVSTIITKPDNPYFNTGDKALFKYPNNWSRIKDGDFVLIKNDEEVMEDFESYVFKVTYNKEDMTLTPLSLPSCHSKKKRYLLVK